MINQMQRKGVSKFPKAFLVRKKLDISQQTICVLTFIKESNTLKDELLRFTTVFSVREDLVRANREGTIAMINIGKKMPSNRCDSECTVSFLCVMYTLSVPFQ